MNSISEKLKSKRKERGLSQKQLAENICEQSQISKIERGNYMPSADLLYKIAQRLKVPLDYFFNDQFEVSSSLSQFKQVAQRFLDNRNYKDLAYILDLEKQKKAFLSTEDRTYLDWIQALLDFYLYDKQELAIEAVERILPFISPKTALYLKVLNTLCNFYSTVGKNQDYEDNYKKLLAAYQGKDLNHQELLWGYIRARHNHVYHLLEKDKNLEAVNEALETIALCKEKQTSYQLAPLLILVGNAGLSFLDKEQAHHYYLQARELCKIYDHPQLLMTIETYLNQQNK
ncbi:MULTISPECIES: helix-turn-helix domain-containing protein [unclassified Streptococcus]|uniref:helix-turn-helix domain-containing protein n=1 Tax=unclassified Streptococcus TaxID=2608887 RepID=UPI00359E4524